MEVLFVVAEPEPAALTAGPSLVAGCSSTVLDLKQHLADPTINISIKNLLYTKNFV